MLFNRALPSRLICRSSRLISGVGGTSTPPAAIRMTCLLEAKKPNSVWTLWLNESSEKILLSGPALKTLQYKDPGSGSSRLLFRQLLHVHITNRPACFVMTPWLIMLLLLSLYLLSMPSTSLQVDPRTSAMLVLVPKRQGNDSTDSWTNLQLV